MIGETVRKILLEKEATFLISDEKVAHVMVDNPLNHALLVLTKVKYSRIPVLDVAGHYVGLIGLSDVVDGMFDMTAIDPQKLDELCVRDVMDTTVPTITKEVDLEYLLHLLVDHPFLPVVNEAQLFAGIVTRKEVLKAVNHLVHTLEATYNLSPKE